MKGLKMTRKIFAGSECGVSDNNLKLSLLMYFVLFAR
jgi:hypothetical protein